MSHTAYVRPRWEQDLIREDVFRWLARLREESGESVYPRADLLAYEYRGVRIPLLDTSKGIRNPRDFDATLSIMTSADKRRNPYEDVALGDGLIRYAYRAGEGGDNVKLRAAAATGVPVVWFEQKTIAGPFYAHYPMYLRDDPGSRTVTLGFSEDVRFRMGLLDIPEVERRYAERMSLVRLHQDRFRDMVMTAYEARCSVCNLGHARLLDAAHITEDSDPQSIVHVTNGLALCKIHHAAYDSRLLGIDADYVVHVNRELLAERDGPMLEHGIKDMNGADLRKLPTDERWWPDRDRLAARFDEFAA